MIGRYLRHGAKRLQFARSRTMAASGKFVYDYARPALTVDAILVTDEAAPQVLMIQRKNEPFQNEWALPGGFVDEMEPLDAAAARELQEETSVDPSHVKLIQTGVFGEPGRDPRGWTVGVAYSALVPTTELGVKAADDAAAARWFPISEVPLPLAFDHQLILKTSFDTLAREAADAGKGALAERLRAGAQRLDGPWRRT